MTDGRRGSGTATAGIAADGHQFGQMSSHAWRKRDVQQRDKAGSAMTSMQFGLFPVDSVGPAGLRYQPDFVSPATERDLIARLQQLPLAPFQFGAFEGKR